MQDGESLVETLFAHDILREDAAGFVHTTSDFEATRAIYHDTYGHADDEAFRETVANLFDIPEADAAERIEAGDVTRESLVTYLSLKSDLPQSVDAADLAAMADIVTEVTPESPVPDDLIELTDDSAVSFLAEHPDCVVVSFKHYCAPCQTLKQHLEELQAAVPDSVTWAGVDGESATSFCSEHDVEAAPTTLLFRDGDLVESKRGWAGAERLIEALEDVYGE